ncbi:MAG: thioredoxin-disulfide reductase [Lachnospiraceae bacterium]|nr:thioredoxin-disulfide reductase [Lachnospiraceae bacterium]
MSDLYDLIIIGSGPAGMTAAIYAGRAELKTLLIERNPMGGGQIVNTYEVDNYPGLPGINGFDLGTKMSEHVDRFDIPRVEAEVQSLDLAGTEKSVQTDQGTYHAKCVLITSGNSPRKLGIPGEEELTGMGVSYCATCDGAFFKNRVTVVAGGGDVAVEDAIFLARGCSKVYLVHRRDQLRAAKMLQTALFAKENVEVLWDSVLTSVNGKDQVTSVTVQNVKTQESRDLPADGVFIAVGTSPNNSFYQNTGLELDQNGYIVAGEDGVTNLPGVFAAGDVRTKRLRQVSTAVGDGANAITSVLEYLI